MEQVRLVGPRDSFLPSSACKFPSSFDTSPLNTIVSQLFELKLLSNKFKVPMKIPTLSFVACIPISEKHHFLNDFGAFGRLMESEPCQGHFAMFPKRLKFPCTAPIQMLTQFPMFL
jgi:hypothetical protein